jgi:MinD-like ATPase involved in chromosome partitioning or flagellar assembly
VWGPTGAPGRSTVCWHLAGEFAARGHVSLVVDADVYGGALAQLAGLVDEAPGLVAACRAANLGALDIPRLLQACRRVPSPGAGELRMLTGLPRAARWPELKPSALEAVLGLARRTADVLLVDCGFCLEDEEVSYDSLAPRRNAATLAALAAADVVLVVGAADPLGLTRLVHGLDDLRQALPAWGGTADVRVVVNRLGASRSARREVGVAVERHAGVTPSAFLPFDPDALEQAQDQCRPLAHSAPRSPLRLALEALAADLVPDRATQRAPRRRRLRAG